MKARLAPILRCSLQKIKYLLSIKAAANEIATHLQAIGHILEKSIKHLLVLEHVVEREHHRDAISPHLQFACTLLLHKGRNRPRRPNATQNAAQNILLLLIHTRRSIQKPLAAVSNRKDHGGNRLTPRPSQRIQVSAIGTILRVRDILTRIVTAQGE